MNKADRRRFPIDHVNGAAIGHVDAKSDTFLVGNQTVAPGELVVALDCAINYRNLVAVNLFCGDQRPIADSNFATIFTMNGIELLERFGLVVGNVDSRNSLDERVADIANRF